MRTETIEYNIYTFDELSKDVQEKVINKYKNDEWNIQLRSDCFYEDCLNYFREHFPNSEPQLQYSLGYCQGDGLEIYGTFNFIDLLHWNISEFSDKEIKTLTYYFTERVRDCLKLDCNRYYTYYHHNFQDFYYPIIDDLECTNTRAINYEVIEKFSKISNRTLKSLCSTWEDTGYDALYNVSDAEIIEEINANEYEFLADGRIW